MVNVKRVKIALTKGRIEKEAVDMFQRAGIDCSEIMNKGRKLIFHNLKDNIDFVLVKAPDVLTYVEHGVVDIGIVGKDTLLEQNKNFYEVLDLGFGQCKFSLAGPKNSDFYSGYNRKKIATKYPNVARDYFRKLGQDVEIIKIEGSVELAPILGLADAIVDIVETGNTLKENGLVVYKDICKISARMVVNMASMKMKKNEIQKIINRVQIQIDKKERALS
ncbi:ATP phosphoribosyltransferase [Clostridium luticellarii]|jgi:ATP phosphoribosyltransferase|uniref:ATP phosphoribosyltransferase n=1 Tax=Clostridium luticellarii TaxID=1691940 RepID=A0A2T0BRK5_9CLOT|nr:ATP phosphoribosyltransferase [Clostridium luticellarii]MCI1943794.1 ATP phosphoribosyltransferase [Clostridium luticellarii]MCI1967055.1 ATP phosphoribosyltransferase [Clostridium luticellarii]MCI1994422.1 ATP phosphoribosyltransferase [Clostridium luticellarii]MCI2038625.1 ATP phosphoribosyltransferase [Clostridium luticellarii]PRR86499.1 ATP phosphoribosyltransferase [Clostridium luticellarii]